MRLFLLVLLAALPGLAMAQQKGKISGQALMTPGDIPVAGAKITLSTLIRNRTEHVPHSLDQP